MLHRLFTVASAISLLLCVAVAAALAWSFVRPTVWPMGRPYSPAAVGTYTELAWGGGYVAVASIETFPPPRVGAGYVYGANTGGWNAMGLHWRDDHMTLLRPTDRTVVAVVNRSTSFTVWLGVPLLVSAVLPAWWLIQRKRNADREKRKGKCPVCGYDLRASKERCPECGTPITSTAN